jgi:hypothetical protein
VRKSRDERRGYSAHGAAKKEIRVKTPGGLVALTIINLGLAAVTLACSIRPAGADAAVPVLRARALEIVDAEGRVRASLGVLAAGTSAAGAAHVETVLLRLITERGRPSVKIAASEEASGASFAGPTGTKESYAILEADAIASSLKLRAEGGREQVIRP